MHLFKLPCFCGVLLAASWLLILPAVWQPVEIRYTQTPTIPFDWDSLQSHTLAFTDTLSGDALYQVKTLEEIPLYYRKDIMTSVCFDTKCRPLDLTVYWNITGRYLGFKLPDQEFLSKYDHKPFTPSEYLRLNALLADSQLPLGNVAFETLIQPAEKNDDQVDAVSGATSRELSAFVVEGAAYTTYTLWNIIYGPTQALVKRLTEQDITPRLLALILHSPSAEDKIWALHRMDASIVLDSALENALLTLIGGDDFFTAYSAINALKPVHLHAESLQIRLFAAYETVNYSLKKGIIEKLKEAPAISPHVISRSRELLGNLNGEALGNMLELYDRHGITDIPTLRAVAGMLAQDNAFIAKKAYQYLSDLSIKDEITLQALNRYRAMKD